MPITPDEAARHNLPAAEEAISGHEKVFDGALQAGFCPGSTETVYVEGSVCPRVPHHIRIKVESELKRRYADAGWTLKHHDDQRDGASWSLTVRRRRGPG